MPTNYLQHFPKPLLKDLLQGRWLPVIGAGMSLNAIIPKGMEMPMWGKLADLLAEDLADFSPNNALDAISAYEHEFGRAKLIERLAELLLINEAQPGIAHKEFCSIKFDTVCTTNFDFLLERQYDLIPAHVHPVMDEDQLSINLSGAGTLLLKLHGDLRHPTRLVASETDYDSFLTSFPLLATYLSNLLITRTAVFIGYSLDDPDFRQMLHVVGERLGRSRRKRYAVIVDASPTEIKRFERRNVHVINLPGTKAKYGEILAAAFRELREYMRENLLSVSQVKEEEPLRELRLPRESQNRLCFFAIPLEAQSVYRQRVFPVIEEAGFVPVTADDVVTPGGNINAKIDSLVDRAAVMIVELGSSWTATELQMALAKQRSQKTRRFHLIVITPSGEQMPADAAGLLFFKRGDLTDLHAVDHLAQHIGQALREISPTPLSLIANEPARLLEVKAYRAAVISAMTLLEAGLRTLLDKTLVPDDRRRMSMHSLVRIAFERDLLTDVERKQVESWSQLRNSVVHTPKTVGAKLASQIVRGALTLLNQKGVHL